MKKILLLLSMAAAAFTANAVDTSINYIEQWGELKLVGNQLSSESGQPIQLKGWSSFGNYPNENCLHNADDVNYMKQYGANCFRIARYIEESAYSDADVKALIDAAEQNGMYCIVDWHLLRKANRYNGQENGNPRNFQDQANSFFSTICNYAKNKKHVIYEICNEPDDCNSRDIKQYAEAIINTITSIVNYKPVIIVGTPRYDQLINTQTIANGDLIHTDKAHIMYAFHFYANEGPHYELLNKEFVPACGQIPVFVSEWGLSSAEPEKNGGVNDYNISRADEFMALCNRNNGCPQLVSWMNWSYGNKKEGSSAFMNGSCGGPGAQLSPSGDYIVSLMGGTHQPKVIVSAKFGGGITLSDENDADSPAVLNPSNYDKNPELADTIVGSASEVGYYDANNSEDENYVEGEKYDPYKLVEVTGGSNKGKMMMQCYASRDWCTVRKNECVDVIGPLIEGQWGGNGLGWISAGEWLNYTFTVNTPGYYKIEVCHECEVYGRGSAEYDDNGKIKGQPKTGTDFILTLVNHPSQPFMVDYGASTETEASVVEDGYLMAAYFSEDDIHLTKGDNNEMVANKKSCEWSPCGDIKGRPVEHGVLFKETGDHLVRLLFPYGFAGDFAGLRFSYAKPWNGGAYPEETFDATFVAKNAADGALVSPSYVKDGFFFVNAKGDAQVIVTNMTGAVVYETAISGFTKVEANLAAGAYSVKVVESDNVASAKILVK